MIIERVVLGEVCDFIRGVTFEGKEASSVLVSGYIPILRAGNIREELIIHNDLIWVPAQRISEDQYLQINDIAICMSSGSSDVLGKTAPITQRFTGSVGAFCGIIRPKMVDPNFIAFWLKSNEFLSWRDAQANGVNIQNLRFSELAEIKISLPPLAIQQRISGILQKADRLRRLRRYARQLSDTYLQSVFLEMFGDNKPQETLFEDILREDPKNGLYLSSEYYGAGVPIVRIDAFYDGKLTGLSNLKRIRANPQQIEEFSIHNNDILINRVNSLEYLGKSALVQDITEPTIFESNMMRIRIDTNKVLPVFVINYLCSQMAHKQILTRVKKAVNQASINQEDVKSLLLPVPSMHIQKKFDEIFNNFRKLEKKYKESERLGEHLFQSLLQQAF